MDAIVDWITHWIRALEAFGTQHETLLQTLASGAGILTAVAGFITGVILAFRWFAGRLGKAKRPDLTFSEPPSVGGSLTR